MDDLITQLYFGELNPSEGLLPGVEKGGMDAVLSSDSFEVGFRLGALLMLELLGG